MAMQEGKVYRVADRFANNPTIEQNGWLWVLVEGGSDGYGINDVGLFRSVATGLEIPIHFGAVEELSDAGG